MSEKTKPEQDPTSDIVSEGNGLPGDRTVFRHGNPAPGNVNEETVSTQVRDRTRIQAKTGSPDAANPTANDPAATRLQATRQQSAHATRIRHSTPQGSGADSTRARKDTGVPQAPSTSPGQNQGKTTLKGRFTLEKVIGVGGMGVVYKAIDRLKVEARDREPYVAIKVLSEEFRSHPESFIALQRESRKTQRIAHPNVVKVYDFDRDGETVFMTMEYMEGVPLDQLIKQYSATGLPRVEAWNILNGLCSALMHAHAENIVHSDFKPGNIFVTDTGIPKIFDFGIARAVANVDRHTGKHKDRTVFDAGSLGALTPAYASLEMLQGQQPDVRDDIYALGCIAYEILTGVHPFNRIPADEAYNSKLRPKKISNIKKRQWRAIEKALAFKREDRLKSVEEFYTLIQPKTRQYSILAATLVVLAAIGAATYYIASRESEPQKQANIQVDQIEFKIRYELFKEKLLKLIGDPSFTPEWEDTVWDEVKGLSELLKGKQDAFLTSSRTKIYALYISQYHVTVKNIEYARAQQLLKNARRYTDDPGELDKEAKVLARLMQENADKVRALAQERQQRQEQAETRARQKSSDNRMFELALKNVNQQLQCQSKLNMREFGVAVNKLRAVDMPRYLKLESDLVVTLAQCITQVGKTQPERAQEDKKYALRIFDNNRVIQGIVITPRDACNLSIAGLGSRGERAVCRDKFSGVRGDGPALVVIPGNGAIKPFAIGKYEVSVREINQFCAITSDCTAIKSADPGLPAVDISIQLVEQYLHWLSQVTQQKYRLPSRKEWIYAANAVNRFVDPNRNCALNSRGIEKGGQLVRANTGVQNEWGLVNYLGNAQEWVFDRSHNLSAIGGSFADTMQKCTVTSAVRHSGVADNQTGFRVLREVNR
ncbi:MAG: protein kinase [Gammaproteobacteria bacterium]|nr:protein kinase [Gammaproteobacteria bacterium]